MSTTSKAYTPTRKARSPAPPAATASPPQPPVATVSPPKPPPPKPAQGRRAAFLEAHGLPPDFEPGDAYEGPEIPDDEPVTETTEAEPQPFMMTHEQIGRYLAMRPSTRRYFELNGRISRKLVDEYDWLWNGSRAVLIPKWLGNDQWQTQPNATASSGA